MVRRLLQTTRGNSFFLFGARRTGKTTYIRDASNPDTSLYIDLLDPEIEDTYRRTPHRLEQQIRALPDTVEWVLIDEVQRAPAFVVDVALVAHFMYAVTERHKSFASEPRNSRAKVGSTMRAVRRLSARANSLCAMCRASARVGVRLSCARSAPGGIEDRATRWPCGSAGARTAGPCEGIAQAASR